MLVQHGDSTGGEGDKIKEHKLREEQVRLVYRDPRRMLLTVRAPFLKMDVLVGNAPHSGEPVEVRKSWWDRTIEIVRGRRDPQPLLVLADANGKVGSLTSEAVGPWRQD